MDMKRHRLLGIGIIIVVGLLIALQYLQRRLTGTDAPSCVVETQTPSTSDLFISQHHGFQITLQPMWDLEQTLEYQQRAIMSLVIIRLKEGSGHSSIAYVRSTDSAWQNFMPIYRPQHLDLQSERAITIDGVEAKRFNLGFFRGVYVTTGRNGVIYEFSGDGQFLDQLFSRFKWHERVKQIQTRVAFERPPSSELPPEVTDWVNNCLKLDMTAFALSREFNGRQYVFVASGRRPNGDHAVRIAEVVRLGDEVLMTKVMFTKRAANAPPSKKVLVLYDLVTFPATGMAVQFTLEGPERPARVASLAGISELREIVAQSRSIKVFEPAPEAKVQRTLTVAGIANVFEANVLYRLLNSEGQRLHSGTTTAAATLDWGYFSITLTIPQSVRSGEKLALELFTLDPDYDEEIDLVTLPVELGEE